MAQVTVLPPPPSSACRDRTFMAYLLLWIALVWLGGIALILGSLMLLGSLLLFWVPSAEKTVRRSPADPQPEALGRLKLLAISVGLTLIGGAIVSILPLPHR